MKRSGYYFKKTKRPTEPLPYLPLMLFFFLALLQRLFFILSMRNHAYGTVSRYIVDSIYYHDWAQALLNGEIQGKEVFFLSPFYPYFLMLIYKIFGVKVIAVQIIQGILGSFNVVLVYLITRKLINDRAAIVGSIIYLLTGVLLFYTITLLPVELTIFLSLLLIYLLIKLSEHSTVLKTFIIGLGAGILMIARPEFLFLLILIIPYFIWAVKPKPIFSYFVFSFGALLIFGLVPWHNFRASQEFIPYTIHSGINFYYGNNHQTDGTWRPLKEFQHLTDISIPKFKYLAMRPENQLLSPSEVSNYWMRKGFKFIKENPRRYIKLLFRKFLLFLGGYEIPNNYYFYETREDSFFLKIAFINFSLIISCALLGMILSFKNPKRYYLLWIFIIIYLLSALLFYVLSRLRAPLIPILIIFMALFIHELINLLRSSCISKVIIYLVLVGLIYGITQINLINKKEFRVQGYLQKGNIYQFLRKFPQALAAYQNALKIDPENILAYYSILECFISMNRPHDAHQTLLQINYLAQTHPGYRYYQERAQARYQIAVRNFNEAAKSLERAVSLAPYDPETYYLLGAVYLTLGKNDRAAWAFARTIELDPMHEEARRALSLLQGSKF
jgi:4-amino-4-deoxy-L-arabinose transferase-like glycosyltransferase